jgi:hypothetical protein
MKIAVTRTKLVGAAIACAAIAVGMACAPHTSSPEDTSIMDSGPIETATPSAPSVVALSPNEQGYIRVESKSGLVRCSFNAELVACQTSADNWARGADGQPFHVASVTSDGHFQWVKADLGALEGIVTMEHQTYGAEGWTIIATADGTKFTNDRTGHGMSVSGEAAEPF